MGLTASMVLLSGLLSHQTQRGGVEVWEQPEPGEGMSEERGDTGAGTKGGTGHPLASCLWPHELLHRRPEATRT